MKSRFLLVAFLLIFLATTWRCQSVKEGVVDPQTSSPITVKEAQNWYQGTSNKGARVAAEELTNRLAYWDGAQNITLTNGTQAVMVPLFYDYRNPVILPKDSQYLRDKGKGANKLKEPVDYTIKKKMLISKDEQNGFRACVLAIIPTSKSRQENKKLETKTFEGTILVYNQDESAFLFSMNYKKGKLISVNRPTSTKGARLAQDCYSAIYQANVPNQVGGSSGNNYLRDFANQLDVPMNFMDNGGNVYSLVDIIPTDCADGNPSGVPWSDPSNPNEAEWVFPRSGGTSPWTGPTSGPNDPPVPIDEGQPIDLSPVDLWFWDMLHRIGGGIAFNEDERTLIRNNFFLTYNINNYVQQYGRKPTYLNYLALPDNASESEFLAAVGYLNVYQPGVPRGITGQELTLLGYGSSSFQGNLKKYYEDAKDATLRSIRRYGFHDSTEDGTTIGNGFKHALFQILHVKSFGRQLGEQISQAHEDGGQQLDNLMDYWNNNQGLIIYDANPNSSIQQFDDATWYATASGFMRYMKQGWSSTVLTPTNQ